MCKHLTLPNVNTATGELFLQTDHDQAYSSFGSPPPQVRSRRLSSKEVQLKPADKRKLKI